MPRDTGPEHDDDALIARYARGEGVAARALSARHAPRALRFATRMLGGDIAEAEDVTQEAMLRLWRAAPGWQPGGAKLSTWLYRVVANLCIDRRRRNLPPPIDPAATPAAKLADGAAGPLAGLVEADRVAALGAALAALPDRQRQAVVLRHLEGMANPEIAAVMDIGVEAVESLVARGKRALAAMLAGRREDLGYDDDH